MKICLISPILFAGQRLRSRTTQNNIGMSFFPPLGLCYIAGMLEREGMQVRIIDRNELMTKNRANLSKVNEITLREMVQFQPDLIGISSTTATFFDVKKNILQLAGTFGRDVKIVLGGPHASALPEDILKQHEDIDIVCRREGEVTLSEIAKGIDPANILGISYRNGSQIVSNADRPPYHNIDDFCFPARHLVDMNFYCRPNPHVMHGLHMRATTVFTSRGCAFDCTFCAGKTALGKKVRLQSPELVIEEIDRLVKDFQVEGIYFADDMFDIKKDRAAIICEMLIKKGLHKKICWYPQLRANSIDRESVALMKRAGAVRADIGFESGSQKILNILKKRTTVEQNYNAAKILHEVGLQFQANTIVGIPGEHVEDIKKTAKMLKEIKPHWIGFGEFIPLPGSKLYEDLVEKGAIKPEYLDITQSYNFTEMSGEELEALIKNIRNKIVIPTRIKSYLNIIC